MRHALLTLTLAALSACGGHDEPTDPPQQHETSAAPEVHGPVAPPTGVRPLEPGEPATPELTGTGGGPGANSVAGVTRAARSLFERCWVDASRSGAARTPVTGVVSLHALADGSVTQAHAMLRGDLPPGFAACIEQTGKQVRFPTSSGPRDVDVPLGFTPVH